MGFYFWWIVEVSFESILEENEVGLSKGGDGDGEGLLPMEMVEEEDVDVGGWMAMA